MSNNSNFISPEEIAEAMRTGEDIAALSAWCREFINLCHNDKKQWPAFLRYIDDTDNDPNGIIEKTKANIDDLQRKATNLLGELDKFSPAVKDHWTYRKIRETKETMRKCASTLDMFDMVVGQLFKMALKTCSPGENSKTICQ